MFDIILAIDKANGIGHSTDLGTKNGLAWDIKKDMTHFREVTRSDKEAGRKNVLIMGRKTADTFKKPLPGRVNVVLTSKKDYRYEDGFLSCESFMGILKLLLSTWNEENYGKVFVIGGAGLVSEAIKYPGLIDQVHLTIVNTDYNLDVKVDDLFTLLDNNFKHLIAEIEKDVDLNSGKEVDLTFTTLVNKYRTDPSGIYEGEYSYLDTMKSLISLQTRSTRNADTYSKFGTSMEFDLQKGFPALTTKRLFWRGVVEELLFFLSGKTNAKLLSDRKVRIWDGNTTPEFYKKVGLNYEEGDMGPMYGFNWRYFGAEYKGMHHDYTGQGEDQFAEVIDLLLNDPHSRRILLTTYNVAERKKGVLYPCHGLTAQFYVRDGTFIDCQMYQRSADWFLGVPFNIASYSLLVHMIVNIVNQRSENVFKPGKVRMVFGDYHLYSKHIDQALTQLSRFPRKLPKLVIKKNIESIEPKYFWEDLKSSDFVLEGYEPDKSIKAEMIA